MLNHLLKSTNALRNHVETVDGLVDENISLKGKNRLLWAGLIGLSALSALSIGSCYENAKNLENMKAENNALVQKNILLKEKADIFEMGVALKDFESTNNNSELQHYKRFIDSIEPCYPDMPDGRSEVEEAKMEKQNEKNQQQWGDACKVLGIDPKELLRLKGLER